MLVRERKFSLKRGKSEIKKWSHVVFVFWKRFFYIVEILSYLLTPYDFHIITKIGWKRTNLVFHIITGPVIDEINGGWLPDREEGWSFPNSFDTSVAKQ